jgi:hypothetical protein
MFLDISVPTAPVFKVNSRSGGAFRLELAIEEASQRVSELRYLPAGDGFQVSAAGLGGTLFTASFSFAHEGAALTLGAHVEFDPQPEPPGLPGAIVSFSLAADPLGTPLREDTEVEMTLRISDPDGQSVPLTRFLVPFVRGDANADGTADMSDAVKVLGFLFLGARMNDCLDAADVNDDGVVDISDPVRLLGHLFLGSESPPGPFTACGVDSTQDKLGCNTFSSCP